MVTYNINGVDFKFNEIPGGDFVQGGPTPSNPEQPFRNVRLTRNFGMGETQVTQEQWFAVMGSNPSKNFDPKDPAATAKHPVENVSWYDCIEYCNKLSELLGLEPVYKITKSGGTTEVEIISLDRNGIRLPTEAEWEYAAACWTFPEGRYGELDDIAWTAENSGGHSHAVGQKLPNMWGLYDMIGNVWEWVYDVYAPYEVEPKEEKKTRGRKKAA